MEKHDAYLFTGPTAESIVEGFCSMNQVGGRMPAILSQTSEKESAVNNNKNNTQHGKHLTKAKLRQIQVYTQ